LQLSSGRRRRLRLSDNGIGGSTVTLVGRYEFDAIVTVPAAVPVVKYYHPLAGLVIASESLTRAVGPVLDRSKHAFRVGDVIGVPWPGSQSQHTHPLHPVYQRGCSHGVVVIGIEDQLCLVALAASKAAGPVVALLESGPLHQIRGVPSRLHLGHIPGHHLESPHFVLQVELQPHTPHRCR
jgi:hypothetical protein